MPKTLEDLDVFGLLDSPPPPPEMGLTVQQFVKLALTFGERLNIADSTFCFNLPTDLESHTSGTPRCCVHLVREEALCAIRRPESLPSIVCGDGCQLHAPPHIHCLFCLRQGGTAAATTLLFSEMRDTFISHSTDHMQKRDALIALLDEDSEMEKDDNIIVPPSELERLAEAEGRHVCFIASVGTARCPIAVVYCAVCEQFAPLATYNPPKMETDSIAGESRSLESAEVIFARFLLACHVRMLKEEQTNSLAPMNTLRTVRVQEESWIFLPTPFLFGEDAPAELTETFEEGSILTHSAAVLPAAKLYGTCCDPRLRLCFEAEREALQSLLSGLPPYSFSCVVVGFAMQWRSEAETNEKVQWVLQQGRGERFRVRRCLVYVEDTDEWIIARVFECSDTVEAMRSVEEAPMEDPMGGIRQERHRRIGKILPLALAEQFRQEEECDNTRNANRQEQHEETSRGAVNNGEEEDGLEGCPYGLEARTVQFFAGMTALAKAMEQLATHFKANGIASESYNES